jgi:parallel beta-helix repeat protein
LLVFSALAVLAVAVAPASAQEGTTITVDTTSDVTDLAGTQTVADLPGPDGLTSLREATIASTNTAGPETIAFDIPTSDPGFDGTGFAISTAPGAEDLIIGDDGTAVDATTQPGGFPITLDGPGLDQVVGLVVASSGNSVTGLTVRDYANGIDVSGSDNLITGVTATANRQGITVDGGLLTATGNEVSDSTVRDNAGSGVFIRSNVGSVVADNTILRNARGVSILGADDVTLTGNLISENTFIGLDFRAESDFAFVPDPASRGGVAENNTITANASFGIRVDAADRFTITRNVIAGNALLGIDLSGGRQDATAVTRNDSRDRDEGANQRLNFPERLSAVDEGTGTVVEGRVDFPEPQSLTIELFASDVPDPSGHGEGERFVGTATADARGRLTATLPGGLAGQWISATSTDAAGNTSEFSEAVEVDVGR